MPFYTATLALSAQPSPTASASVSPQQTPVLHCPWHRWAILFHLLAPMGLVTVALQVSREYKLCWRTATQSELNYSTQKQIRPFIKGKIPGHLSLLSYLYSVLKRKLALCLRSKSSSIAGFSSPAAGLQPQSHLQKGQCGKGLSSPGFPHPITPLHPGSIAEDEMKLQAPHQLCNSIPWRTLFCIPSPLAQLGQDYWLIETPWKTGTSRSCRLPCTWSPQPRALSWRFLLQDIASTRGDLIANHKGNTGHTHLHEEK